MIILYAKNCESCSGNQALLRIKALCEKHKVDFQERRTILWEVYENEAKQISSQLDIELPFFYNTDTGKALKGDSFTPTSELEKLIVG